MKPGESVKAFKRFALANGVKLSRCTPRQGIEQMLAFYREVKPVGCEEEDGDMLLFQYGTYDWGDGRTFEIDVTRQFMDLHHVFEDEDDEEDGDGQATMSQLHLTFHFAPSAELDALGAGNKWYESPAAEKEFLAFVFGSKALALVGDRTAAKIELEHELV